MPQTIPIRAKIGTLPFNYSNKNGYEFFRAFIERLEMEIDTSQIIVGFFGTSLSTDTAPLWDVGPWYKLLPFQATWWSWSDKYHAYAPIDYIIRNGTAVMSFVGAPTANRSQIVPDPLHSLPGQPEVVALMVDTLVPRATIALSGAAPIIDGNLSNDFLQRLSANAVPRFADSVNPPFLNGNTHDGQKIRYVAQNNGTSFTVAFPAYVQWPSGGAQPVQPVAASAGINAVGIWEFRQVRGTLYGELIGASATTPSTVYDPGGPDDVPDDQYTPESPIIPIHNLP